MLSNDFIHLSGSNRKYSAWVDSAAFVAGAMTAFVNAHVWNPASTYYCVLLLVCADFVTGVWVGHRSASGIETRKAKKVLGTLFFYTAFMLFAHQFAKAEPVLFWLPQAVLAPIVVINFTSMIKNASLLGFIPEKISELLYKNIDKYKNPNKDDFNSRQEHDQADADADVLVSH